METKKPKTNNIHGKGGNTKGDFMSLPFNMGFDGQVFDVKKRKTGSNSAFKFSVKKGK